MTQENNNKENDLNNQAQTAKPRLGLKLGLPKTMDLANIDLNKQIEKPAVYPEKLEITFKTKEIQKEYKPVVQSATITPESKVIIPDIKIIKNIDQDIQEQIAMQPIESDLVKENQAVVIDKASIVTEKPIIAKVEIVKETSPIVSNIEKKATQPQSNARQYSNDRPNDRPYSNERRHQSSDDGRRRNNREYDNNRGGGFNQYEHETRLAVLKAAAENRKNKEEEIARLKKAQEEARKAEEAKQAIELEMKKALDLENEAKLIAQAKIKEEAQAKIQTNKESKTESFNKIEVKKDNFANFKKMESAIYAAQIETPRTNSIDLPKIETKAFHHDENQAKLKKSIELDAKNIRPTANAGEILARRKEAEELLEENKRKENARIAANLRDKRRDNIRPGMLNTYKDENGGDAKEIFSSRQQAYRRKPTSKNNRMQKPVNAFITQDVIIDESHSVKELANLMNIKTTEVIKALSKIDKKMRYKEDTQLDAEMAEFLVLEFGHKPIFKSLKTIDNLIAIRVKSAKNSLERPPVVTIMGHVDHGKTSLLDALRSSNVVATESGGITQHIGAYQIISQSGKKISFIDTPGHEAFTAIRARGAQATDIVVLVVAADDGVMPQTVEAIRHAQVANVPMIVAINKIDKTNGDITNISNQLIQYDVMVESVGGEIMAVPISAKNKTNLDKLEEAILLQAEIMELRADDNLKAVGVIIESKVNNVKGCCATLLIQNGTLKIGDILITNDKLCKVRAMNDEHGKSVKLALPSTAVEVFGFDKTPDVGQKFIVVSNEKEAKHLLEEFSNNDLKQQRLVERGESSNIDIFNILEDLSQETVKELKFIIKADVSGTIDAVKFSLDKLNSDLVLIKILYAATGAITESDIALAKSSGAVVCGFNINVNATVQNLVSKEKVTLRSYTIIYQLIDDVKAMIDNKLKPQKIEKSLGRALVKQIFMISGTDKIAGCEVRDGLVSNNAFVRIKRTEKGVTRIVGENISIRKLKRHKDDVREVTSGLECGIALDKFDDIIAGDMLEIYNIIENI